MKLSVLCMVALVAGTAAWAQDEDRAKLNGSWQAQEDGPVHSIWTFEAQGETMHITSSQGDKKLLEYVCELGKECDGKSAGKKVKVTLYFNGPKLVVLETRGDTIVKRLFGVAEKGDLLELENIPVSPSGSTETAHLTRVQTTAVAAKTK